MIIHKYLIMCYLATGTFSTSITKLSTNRKTILGMSSIVEMYFEQSRNFSGNLKFHTFKFSHWCGSLVSF